MITALHSQSTIDRCMPQVRRGFQVVGMVFLLSMLLTACGDDDREGSVYFGSGGMVGIPFRNGVECLGDEALTIEGDIIYVSPDGDDENMGHTPDEPLRTVAQALCSAHPGQTVRIMPGTYQESVILGEFGDSAAPITIQGVLDGEQRPVLEGSLERTMGIGLVECQNIVVENIAFRNYTDEGLYILEGSDFVIRNNLFFGNGRASIDPEHEGEGFGVNVLGATRVLIEENEAAENGPGADRVQDFVLGTGINTYELVDSVIRNNTSHGNTGGGILVEDSTNVLVEGNRITDNELDANGDYWDGGIWIDGGHGITLKGNVITENHGPGIEISDENVQYPDGSYGYLLEGNVITGNIAGIYIWNFGHCPFPDAEIIDLVNNTVQDNVEDDFWCEEWACGENTPCD